MMERSKTTIFVKSESGTGEETLEEVELDGATSDLLEQLSATGNAVSVDGDRTAEVVDVQQIFQNFQGLDNSAAGGGGSAYVLNQETGEIQLIQLNDGEEVEVITVDADGLLGGEGSVEQVQVTESLRPVTVGGTQFGGIRQSPAVGGSFSGNRAGGVFNQGHRLRSAPAMLRNYRRIAPADNAADRLQETQIPSRLPLPRQIPRATPAGSLSKGNNRKSRSGSGAASAGSSLSPGGKAGTKLFRRGGEVASTSTSSQIFLLNSSEDGGHLVETSQPMQSFQLKQLTETVEHGVDQRSFSIQGQNFGTQNQPTYYIYQDADGDQVAELVESASGTNFDPATSNIIYQFENDSIFMNEGDLASLGTLVNLPKVKLPKASKKRSRAKARALQNETDDNSMKIKKGCSELKCMEKGCPAIAYNVADLRKHLTRFHDLTFDMDTQTFPTDSAFKEWREEYERERMVSFIYRGGTKKIAKDQSVTYMICHRSGHYKPTMANVSQRKRRMKPQGSCKIGGYCTAGIKLLKNLDTGMIKMDICHTHYGHPLDSEAIPHLRVNPTLRKIILRKFEEGLSFSDVLAYIHHNPDCLEGLRMVDRRAVRNIYDTWKNPVKRKNISNSAKAKASSMDDNIMSSENKEVDELILPEASNDAQITDDAHVHVSKEENMAAFAPAPVEIDANETDDFTENIEMIAEMHSSERVDSPEFVEETLNATATKVGPIQENMDCEEEDAAPVLYAASELTKEYGVEEYIDDDSNPPLLIAIESIKSLKPASPAGSISQEIQKRKAGKRKRKGMKILRLKKSDPSLKTEPTAVKSESVQDKTGYESPSKENYKLRSSRKVEVPCPSNHDVKKDSQIEHPITSLTTYGKSKNSKSAHAKMEMPMELEETSETDPPVGLIDSPLCPVIDNDSDIDDFELTEIQIQPELEAAIDKLHNHGEAGPSILLFKKIGDINTKYGGFCRAFREDDFCLIIQTPVQRQILQMFPKIIAIEILDSPKPNDNDLKLAFVMVLDDFREAIPVAWMIADTMCSRVLNQFFRMLRYHCGELQVRYIMAPRNADVYKTWSAHFSNKPKMLQSEFSAKRDLRTLVNRHFPNDSSRSATWGIVEKMITEKNVDEVDNLRQNLSSTLKKYPNGPNLLKKIEKDWFSRIEEWSFAYRIGASANLLFATECFTKLKKFVSFKGTRKLNQSIDHILKIGYDKCFLRTKRMFKGDQKFSFLLETVEKSHNTAKNLFGNVSITEFENEHRWKIETEDDQVAEVFHLQSPCDCKISCKICKICIHEYMCSCDEFYKQQIMCAHIHKIHCFRMNISEEEEGQEELCTDNKFNLPVTVVMHEDEMMDVSSIPVMENSQLSICEGTEITIVNDNQIEHIDLTEVMQAAAGLFRSEDGHALPKIVSITDVNSSNIYDNSGSGPIVLQFDTD